MPISHQTAVKLRDALLECHELSDWHSVPSYESACSVTHAAGLGTALIPIARGKQCRTNSKYDLFLAVVEPHLRLGLQDQPRVYASCQLVPITSYLGDLANCNLRTPWWAAPQFFCAVSQCLAPYVITHAGGRSHWGEQSRAAFADAFDARWSDPELTIHPQEIISSQRIPYRFSPITTNADLMAASCIP